jgi:hypothetical protein
MRKSKAYPIGYFDIDIAEVRTAFTDAYWRLFVSASRRPRALAACAGAAAGAIGHPFAATAARRRGGRAAEGARLESVYAGNRIAGSNPAPSANIPASD